MRSILRSLPVALLILTFFSPIPRSVAKDAFAAVGSRPAEASTGPIDGPGDVYANIPQKDDRGRDQIAMFRAWNPDPVGNHEANLKALNPLLARVIRKTQADNPDLPFVIGSGKRDKTLQSKAVAWGWSKIKNSLHRTGDAVDLWPLDSQGRVTFDQTSQSRIGAAMKKSASELKVPIRWGGHFHRFKGKDRSHFELVARQRTASVTTRRVEV
jgi:peptidoglycan LD-endopeptidase CwlK